MIIFEFSLHAIAKLDKGKLDVQNIPDNSSFVVTDVALVLYLQPLEEKEKINYELEERKYAISQDGKTKEIKERDPFAAVEDFKPVGPPWSGRY